MTDEEKARHARELMRNPLFAVVLQDLHNDVVREWATTDPTDSARRETLYFKQMGLVQLEQAIKVIAN